MRDALRGPFNDNHKGAFLAGIPGEEESIKFGIVGAVSHPQVNNDSVNYSKAPWAVSYTHLVRYKEIIPYVPQAYRRGRGQGLSLIHI